MGGMLSAFYAILCCSRREATAFTPLLRELALPCAVCRYMDDVYVAIAYANDDHLTQATKVVHFIAAEGTGSPAPLVLNLEPEGPQRFLELYIKCVGTAIVVSFYNKVADDWIKTGSTVQVRSSSFLCKCTTQAIQTRARSSHGWSAECLLCDTVLQSQGGYICSLHPNAARACPTVCCL